MMFLSIAKWLLGLVTVLVGIGPVGKGDEVARRHVKFIDSQLVQV